LSELEDFVLGCVEQAGGLVEPRFGVYETLLPEEAAARWQLDAYVELAFAETEQEDALLLGYNHPLVEQMAAEVRGQTASTAVYIPNLRLNKSELDNLATKGWSVVNARVLPRRRATTARVSAVYVQFNFKAAILSDEKQEQLVSVLLDAHTGAPAADPDLILQRATAVSPDPILRSLPDAPMRWQPGDKPLKSPLDLNTLEALLERAKTAVTHQLSAQLTALQKQIGRFRELDEARLTGYYDELERDLQQRLNRASPDRRASLQEKLETVKTERIHKLADIAERSQVRLDLTLLNLMVIRQPKLVMPINIENRATKIRAYAVWDPLRHELEPLVCDVCNLPAERVYLCHNGHLAHKECLAPACIDCKRVFCTKCSEDVGECDVCRQPLCVHSRIACPECGRFTCQAHREMCHANNGQPVDLNEERPSALEPPPPKPVKPAKKPSPKRRKPKRKPARKAAPTRPKLPKGTPKPQRMEVILDPIGVTAFLLGSRERTIARRTWELVPSKGGVVRSCDCEKGSACEADGMVTRPSEWKPIEAFIKQEITDFRLEYGLPAKKVKFNRASSLDGGYFPITKFKLTGLWQDEEALDEARDTFERLYWD
jgi:hypothetical protein